MGVNNLVVSPGADPDAESSMPPFCTGVLERGGKLGPKNGVPGALLRLAPPELRRRIRADSTIPLITEAVD